MLYFAETSYYGNEGILMVHLEETTTKCFTTNNRRNRGKSFLGRLRCSHNLNMYVDVSVGDQLL
jgi:hypothetical protein